MPGPSIFIISGEQGEGKSTFAKKLAIILREKKYAVRGIIAKGSWKDGLRSGFELIDLESGMTMPLAARDQAGQPGECGSFTFNDDAVAWGRSILSLAAGRNEGVILLDEVGPLELRGEVWAPVLDELIAKFSGILVITVRLKLLEDVTHKWDLTPVAVIHLSSSTPQEAAGIIEKHSDGKLFG